VFAGATPPQLLPPLAFVYFKLAFDLDAIN
jgi:hypothetical protein